MNRLPLILAACSLALAVSACSTRPSAEPAAALPAVTDQCNAARVQAHVGQAANEEVVERLRNESGAATVRTIRPDQAVTLDYRGDRLNVRTDAGDVITALDCG